MRNVMILSACSAWLLSTGATVASPPDERVSGLLHQPLGGISTFTVLDRRLSACCLGSSGEDGVEVLFSSVYGGGVTLDLTELLAPTPTTPEIRIRPRGWDGTIKGNVRLIGNSDGTVTEIQDFSTIGATAMQWRAYDLDGNLIEQGTVAGPVVSMTLDGFGSYKVFAVEKSSAGIIENKNVFVEFHEATVTGLSSSPISGVHQLIVTPEFCPGCPNPWTDVDALLVTGIDMSELVVEDAHLRTFGIPSWGTGVAHLSEDCIGFPPPCAGTERGFVVDNIGTSGLDGVTLDFGPGSTGGEVSRGRCKECPPGHVIIMKLFDDGEQEACRVIESSNPATGQGTLAPDFSAVGSAEFDVAYIGTDGSALAVERCASGTELDTPNPDDVCSNGHDTWRLGAGASDVFEKRFCEPTGLLALPSGLAVSGVSAMRFRAVDASAVHGSVRYATITSPDPDPIVIEHAAADTPVFASGIPHYALGGVSSLSVDGRRLSACCLGSSGEDGVEVRFDSLHGGGASVDIQELLPATGVAREIRVRPKGWDGTIKGTLRLLSDADGLLSEVYDFSTIGATAMEWRLLNAHDGVLAEGSVSGPVLSWGLDLAAPPGECNKLYQFESDAEGFSARQGFFDLAVTVTGLTSVPVSGIHAIEVRPVPCAGCPNGPWDDIASIDLTADGLSELVLTAAHRTTFGVESWSTGHAHLSEQCADPLLQCGPSDSELHVTDVEPGSLEGVAIDFGPNAGGGSVGVAKEKCCRGHVIIMKLYDDEGNETFRTTQTEDPLAGEVELLVDPTGVGATDTVVTFYNTNGAAITSALLAGAGAIYYDPCPAGYSAIWKWIGYKYIFYGCTGPSHYRLAGGVVVPNVAYLEFEPVSPVSPRASSFVTISTDDPIGFIVDHVERTPAAIGDVDLDGDVDLVDFNVLAECLAGPGAVSPPACDALHFRRCDLDADVDVDLHDFGMFQQALAGD